MTDARRTEQNHDPSGRSASLRIEAGDFRVANCGKSKPGRVGDEGVCRGAIDLACGGNAGHDRSFQSKNVDQRAFAASCDIQSFIASLRYRQGAALQIRQRDQGSHRVEGGHTKERRYREG